MTAGRKDAIRSGSNTGRKSRERLPDGLKIGHAHDGTGLTGCTVLLFDDAVLAAADIRGSAPATGNFSLLDPGYVSSRVDAILLTGGSSFGLWSAIGVQRFLEDRGRGIDVGVTTIPRIPAAAIFDLAIGDYTSRPTPQMALDACLAAGDGWPEEGSVGAGMGATVGKFLGIKQAMRGGFGVSRAESAAGAQIWAFAVVNAFGDIWEAGRQSILAGARTGPESVTMADTARLIRSGWQRMGYGPAVKVLPPDAPPAEPPPEPPPESTTLIVVATTARLDAIGLRRLASSCHLGLTSVVHPAHTIYDGDLAIAVSMGTHREDETTLAVLAQQAVQEAILRAVKRAERADDLPAWSDLRKRVR